MNFKNTIYSSPLFERLSVAENFKSGDTSRINMYILALTNVIDKPFGDGTLDTAHNLWLDILKQTGWIPFMFLIVFTFSAVKNISIFIKSKNFSESNRFLVLSIIIAYFLNFFVEPIMKGAPYYFSSFCICLGCIEKINRISIQKKVKVN